MNRVERYHALFSELDDIDRQRIAILSSHDKLVEIHGSESLTARAVAADLRALEQREDTVWRHIADAATEHPPSYRPAKGVAAA